MLGGEKKEKSKKCPKIHFFEPLKGCKEAKKFKPLKVSCKSSTKSTCQIVNFDSIVLSFYTWLIPYQNDPKSDLGLSITLKIYFPLPLRDLMKKKSSSIRPCLFIWGWKRACNFRTINFLLNISTWSLIIWDLLHIRWIYLCGFPSNAKQVWDR